MTNISLSLGMGYCIITNGFMTDLEDLADKLEADEEEFPQDNIGIYGTTQEKLCFSFDNLHDMLSDNACEDWEMDEDQQKEIE